MTTRILLTIIALGYTAGVLYFSWTPAAPHTGTDTEVLVKRWLFNMIHPPVYAGMMILWYAAIKSAWEWRWRVAASTVLLVTAVGVVGELGQFNVPNRYPDWTDGTLNFVGACLGAGAIYYMTTRWTFLRRKG